MKFFTVPITVRMKQETLDDIRILMEKYPDEYSSLSHVVRCAVISLFNDKEVEEENETRRIKSKLKR